MYNSYTEKRLCRIDMEFLVLTTITAGLMITRHGLCSTEFARGIILVQYAVFMSLALNPDTGPADGAEEPLMDTLAIYSRRRISIICQRTRLFTLFGCGVTYTFALD